jgi:UDP-N-acetylmuramate--alanine ligase
MKINIASNEVVHFIGIGGIGMSGLAQVMKNMGFRIQGSDLNQNKNTERLIQSGIKVYFSHLHKNLKKATVIVMSSAIKKNNEELKTAKHRKLPIYKRGDMLANIVALKKTLLLLVLMEKLPQHL